MIYAIILAGGKGVRFGNTEKPKQFLNIGTKPIIIHTLEQFIINQKIDKIIVCCPAEWLNFMKSMIEEHLPNNENIFVTEGGSDRNESLMSGCKFIEEHFGVNDNDKMITHDAVRPFVTQRIIDDNIKALEQYSAVDTCISATDTIVEAKREQKQILNIPERKYMYQGQTPQSFYIKEWTNTYHDLTSEEKEILTDACKMFVLKNKEVAIVNGEVFNIKITTPFDLKLANAIVEGKES